MKTRKVILLIIFMLGLMILWLLSSFRNLNACEYANSNLEYFKVEIQKSIVQDNFEMSKYHAFKALNGIEKTKSNFLDCGCEGTIVSLEATSEQLKVATRAKNLILAKKSLHQALQNIEIGINVLQEFGQEIASMYGTSILTMNTKRSAVEKNQYFMYHTHTGNMKDHVHTCLLGFQSSLDKVVKEVNCKEADAYINRVLEEARLKLLNTNLTEPKKQYYQRVQTIAKEALLKLGDCPKKSLLAGK